MPIPIRAATRGCTSLGESLRTIEEAACIVTARYHASVLAVIDLVPVVGVSMDERIAQLFNEYGFGDSSSLVKGRHLRKRGSTGVTTRHSTTTSAFAHRAQAAADPQKRTEEMGLTLSRFITVGSKAA